MGRLKSALLLNRALVIVSALCLGFALTCNSAPKDAIVTHLPGFDGNFPSKHYSGYVTVDQSSGKRLFYYFVLSERDPSSDPVVLWLNGGPGCSSFDGFVYEHGPFNFELTNGSSPKLHLNQYSWSKVSNIIYLDSPAGVGFSYANSTDAYRTGDNETALDSHAFLLKWFQLYPEFVSNPFFIAGESYAGVYVPTLSFQVAEGITSGEKPVLNFKGYLVGNGVTDDEIDGNALIPFAYGMALISNQLYQAVKQACNGSYYRPTTTACREQLNKVDAVLDDLNIYDILEDCYHDPSSGIKMPGAADSRLPSSFRKLGETEKPLGVRKRMFGRSWPFRAPVRPGLVPTWPQLLNSESVPCTDDEVATSWLNNPELRKAIHAEDESLIGRWMLCTDQIRYYHNLGSMIMYHKNLTARGYRALIFSGDHDMCVPYTGSQAWTQSLGYEIVDEWRPWFSHNQVAGFTQGYAHNLTFLTIKGSGHTVPEYKPRESLDFYSRFLAGEKI